MNYANKHSEPWHRNPWVWLIIAIPGLTILGCAFTIYLALTNPETLVGEYGAAHHSGTAIRAICGLG